MFIHNVKLDIIILGVGGDYPQDRHNLEIANSACNHHKIIL